MVEIEEHQCPECHEPVVTGWDDWGLLMGDYVTPEDGLIYHTECYWGKVKDRILMSMMYLNAKEIARVRWELWGEEE